MYRTGTLTSLISYWQVGHFCFITVVHFSVVIHTGLRIRFGYDTFRVLCG